MAIFFNDIRWPYIVVSRPKLEESRDRVGVTHDDRLQDPFEQYTLTLSREWPHSLQLVFDLKMLR